MLPDPRTPHRLAITWSPGTAYLLKVPTVYERARYRQQLAAHGARRHGTAALAAELRRGIEAVMAGDDVAEARAALLAAVDAGQAAFDQALALVAQGDDAAVAEAWDAAVAHDRKLEVLAAAVHDGHEPYRAMLADNQVYWQVAGLVAAKLFLAGWEGIDVPFRRNTQGVVPDELLAVIPEAHLPVISRELEGLLAPGEARAKN